MLQTLTFQAGGRQINAAATFFRYESGGAAGSDDAIRLRADGQDLGLYSPGDSIELPGQAVNWEIVPVSANCVGVVRLGIGRVQSARLSGMVRVVDEITDAILSQGFSPALAVAPISYIPIVAPAANVRGVILRFWTVSAVSAGAGFASLQLTAAKVLPTGYSTPAQRYTIAGAGSQNGTPSLSEGRGNKLLPPGWGVYYGGEVAGGAAQSFSGRLEYEVL